MRSLCFGAVICVQSAAARGDRQADMLESLGFITTPLPADNKREFSMLQREGRVCVGERDGEEEEGWNRSVAVGDLTHIMMDKSSGKN